MKFMKNTLLVGLAAALPISFASQNVVLANTLDIQGPTTADVAAQVHAAKDRMSTAKIRLDIAKKQVVAAKARLKAAEAEYKAAKENHKARNLQHEAHKLSESSGLPAITNTMIEEKKQKSLASKITGSLKKSPKQANNTPVDLSNTRIQQVDFNAPGYENKQVIENNAPHSSYAPARKLSTGNASQMQTGTGTGLVANSPLEQPPIVP